MIFSRKNNASHQYESESTYQTIISGPAKNEQTYQLF